MTTTTAVKTPRTLIPAASSNAAGGSTEGTPVDMRTRLGATLSAKLTNGATGPTVQARLQILVAYTSAATPAGAAAGADWKLYYEFGGGTVANAVTEVPITLPLDVMHVHARVTGNTVQAVVAECLMAETTSINTA